MPTAYPSSLSAPVAGASAVTTLAGPSPRPWTLPPPPMGCCSCCGISRFLDRCADSADPPPPPAVDPVPLPELVLTSPEWSSLLSAALSVWDDTSGGGLVVEIPTLFEACDVPEFVASPACSISSRFRLLRRWCNCSVSTIVRSVHHSDELAAAEVSCWQSPYWSWVLCKAAASQHSAHSGGEPAADRPEILSHRKTFADLPKSLYHQFIMHGEV
mmetsp:Transcript_17777/g.50879  ORF Transcript_17777/g.50879 Transcript_17777/m.50879 type:complete len:215 (+) Transcript_17777:90-734(+)